MSYSTNKKNSFFNAYITEMQTICICFNFQNHSLNFIFILFKHYLYILSIICFKKRMLISTIALKTKTIFNILYAPLYIYI